MDMQSQFKKEVAENIVQQGQDKELLEQAHKFMITSGKYKYSYNFSWLGRPILQLPQDIIAMQEIIWQVKPDLIIETGIAHGGSLIFHASMLELIGGTGEVLGLDIDIRKHNKISIEEHPMFKRITMLEGDSTSEAIANQVKELAKNKKNIMVVLDSHHTQEHVLKELNLYAPLVGINSYCVVYDTIIEEIPDHFCTDRPWGKGNNPKTAVWEFLKANNHFEIDNNMQNKLLITAALDGYLKRVK